MSLDTIRESIRAGVRQGMEVAERHARTGVSIHQRQGGKPSAFEQSAVYAETMVLALVRQEIEAASATPAPAAPEDRPDVPGFVLPPGCTITAGWVPGTQVPRLQIKFPEGDAEPCKAAADLLRARMMDAAPSPASEQEANAA